LVEKREYMMDLYNAPALYEKLIRFDEAKQIQIRLVVNTFHGVEYLHLRKYYLDFSEEWKPSNEGIAIPLDIPNSRGLFEGLVEILSQAESENILEEHFKDLLDKMYKK
jgi:hypothetical protein